MRYSGIQPQYFPRLHYLARILNADIFVVRDDVQFVRKHKYPDGHNDKSYQANTPIKQSFGINLLTVPTQHEGMLPIHQTKISYEYKWVEDHLKALQTSYSRAKNFDHFYPEIETLLSKKYSSIGELNLATIIWSLLHILGKQNVQSDSLTLETVNKLLREQNYFRLKEIRLASKIKALDKNLSANEKIAALCREIGADEDYCGKTGFDAYMDQDFFKTNGIKITVQDWHCQPYDQLFTKQQGFLPNLSIIDLLMNTAQPEAARILSSWDHAKIY